MGCFAQSRNERLEELHRRAARRDVQAQYELGEHYLNGDIIAKNSKKAKFWFKQAAKLGNVEAQVRLAHCYENGIGCRRNRAKAIGWTESAAKKGHAVAQARYGHYSENGFLGPGRRPLIGRAITWYERSAKQGFVDAQFWMGKYYEKPDSLDFVQVIDWYSKAAEQGHAEAQQALLRCFDNLGKCEPQQYLKVLANNKVASQERAASIRVTDGFPTLVEDYKIKANGFLMNAQYKEALPWLIKAANAGYPPAYGELYALYSFGGKVARDRGRERYYRQKYEEQLRWFQHRAYVGNAEAQYYYGYWQGVGARPTYARTGYPGTVRRYLAVDWYCKAAEQGHAMAQLYLGLCYEDSATSSRNLALTYRQGTETPEDKNSKLAFSWYQKAAAQGLVEAEVKMGDCYLTGRGVAKSENFAFRKYERAAKKGDARGQYALGLCYSNGSGVSKSNTEALRWVRFAAEQGLAEAQCQLGTYYLEGNIVPKNEVEGIRWIRQAVEQDFARGQFLLGNCYKMGQGVPKNDIEAVNWCRKAAEQCYPDAQYSLGVCYEEGRCIAKDEAEAMRLYHEAAKQGHVEAKQKIEPSENRKKAEKLQQQQQQEQEKLKRLEQQRIQTEKTKLAAIKNPPTASYRNADYDTAERLYLDVRYKDALPLLERAASAGYPPAYMLMADIYCDFDINRVGDQAKALECINNAQQYIEWFQLYAAADNIIAQVSLGRYYAYPTGIGVVDIRDEKKSTHWLRKAAEKGHFLAQYYLGNAYKFAYGTNRDKKEARVWYEKSAKQGYVHAKYKMGECYFDLGLMGDKSIPDYNQAKTWFRAVQAQVPDYHYLKEAIEKCDEFIRKEQEFVIKMRELASEREARDELIRKRDQEDKEKAMNDKIRTFRFKAYPEDGTHCLADHYNKRSEEELSPEDKILFRRIVNEVTKESVLKEQEKRARASAWEESRPQSPSYDTSYEDARDAARKAEKAKRRERSAEWRHLDQHDQNPRRREELEQQGYGRHGSKYKEEECTIS